MDLAAAGDERLMQLLRMMNKLLDKHPESRSRQLNFSAPLVVPIWPQVSFAGRPGAQMLAATLPGYCHTFPAGT